jgi:hypothetical protein
MSRAGEVIKQLKVNEFIDRKMTDQLKKWVKDDDFFYIDPKIDNLYAETDDTIVYKCKVKLSPSEYKDYAADLIKALATKGLDYELENAFANGFRLKYSK